jgi:hypothetical protein
MVACWRVVPEERPSFVEISERMDVLMRALTNRALYTKNEAYQSPRGLPGQQQGQRGKPVAAVLTGMPRAPALPARAAAPLPQQATSARAAALLPVSSRAAEGMYAEPEDSLAPKAKGVPMGHDYARAGPQIIGGSKPLVPHDYATLGAPADTTATSGASDYARLRHTFAEVSVESASSGVGSGDRDDADDIAYDQFLPGLDEDRYDMFLPADLHVGSAPAPADASTKRGPSSSTETPTDTADSYDVPRFPAVYADPAAAAADASRAIAGVTVGESSTAVLDYEEAVDAAPPLPPKSSLVFML